MMNDGNVGGHVVVNEAVNYSMSSMWCKTPKCGESQVKCFFAESLSASVAEIDRLLRNE